MATAKTMNQILKLILLILIVCNFSYAQEVVLVTFNEWMDTVGMSTPSNFQWDNGLVTLSAELIDTSTCRLMVSEPVHNLWYTVEVFNVFDLAGNIVNPEKDTAAYIWYPVPVEMVSFTTKLVEFENGFGVLLQWETATEINNYGFEIQRDKKTIAFIEGNGNSNSPKSYMYSDDYPVAGRHTYRLKQVDNDGTFEYSTELSINVGQSEIMHVYPNPTTNQFCVQLTVLSPYHKVMLYTLLGELIAEYEPKEKIYITSNLSSGVYIVSYMGKNIKLMVVK